MPEYYNFHKPGGEAYTCLCPAGIRGDMCESCDEIEGLYRYQSEQGVCADCSCSDLSTSDQCNKATGQCSCETGLDVQLAGRQCVSKVFNHCIILCKCIYLFYVDAYLF